MKVVVVEESNNIVRIKTALGTIVGKWCSPKPAILKSYFIEIDCDDTVSAEHIQVVPCCNPFIANKESNTIVLCGLVEAIEDELFFLRLSNDLVMLKTDCTLDAYRYVDKYVQVILSNIKFYDIGVG